MIFFLKFQIHHCTIQDNPKHNYQEKRETIKQNGVKFGTRGE